MLKKDTKNDADGAEVTFWLPKLGFPEAFWFMPSISDRIHTDYRHTWLYKPDLNPDTDLCELEGVGRRGVDHHECGKLSTDFWNNQHRNFLKPQGGEELFQVLPL